MRTLIAFSLLFHTLLLAALSAEEPATAPLKVGVILPLSGDAAFWGLNPRRGTELALVDLKEGSPAVQLLYEDDACSPQRAVAAFHRLVDVEKVQVILGPVCSSATLAVAPLAEQRQIPLFAFSEADAISDAGEYIFRLWVPNGRQGRTMAEHIHASGYRRLSILAIENDFGDAIVRTLKARFEELGGEVLAVERYLPEKTDYRAETLRLRAKGPDAVFVAAYIQDGIAITKRMHELKFNVQTFFSGTIHSPDFLQAVGSMGDGFRFADLEDTTASEFYRRWQEEFGEEWPGLASGASIFYDVVTTLNRLARDGKTSSEAVRSSFSSGREITGAAGVLAFDERGDLQRTHEIYSIQGGGAVRWAGE